MQIGLPDLGRPQPHVHPQDVLVWGDAIFIVYRLPIARSSEMLIKDWQPARASATHSEWVCDSRRILLRMTEAGWLSRRSKILVLVKHQPIGVCRERHVVVATDQIARWSLGGVSASHAVACPFFGFQRRPGGRPTTGKDCQR